VFDAVDAPGHGVELSAVIAAVFNPRMTYTAIMFVPEVIVYEIVCDPVKPVTVEICTRDVLFRYVLYTVNVPPSIVIVPAADEVRE
jgi:hypothetical protein